MEKVDQNKKEISIRDLYPNLSEEELKEAERNLDAYLELTMRIYARILNDPQAMERFKSMLSERKNQDQRK